MLFTECQKNLFKSYIPYRTKIRRTKVSKFQLGVENFVRRNILSVENFVQYFNTKVRQKSDKTVEISAWCRKFCPTKYFVRRKFCPTKFCPIRYARLKFSILVAILINFLQKLRFFDISIKSYQSSLTILVYIGWSLDQIIFG